MLLYVSFYKGWSGWMRMEQGDKIVLAIVVGAVIVGVSIFLSFGMGGGVTGAAVGVKDIVHFEGEYDCDSNVYNCGSFDSRADAQDLFDVCGGVDNDVHSLDGDGDGLACEGLR